MARKQEGRWKQRQRNTTWVVHPDTQNTDEPHVNLHYQWRFFSATVNNAPQHGVATSTQKSLQRHIHNRSPGTTSHDTLKEKKKTRNTMRRSTLRNNPIARAGSSYFEEWRERADRIFNNTTRRTWSGFRSLKDQHAG